MMTHMRSIPLYKCCRWFCQGRGELGVSFVSFGKRFGAWLEGLMSCGDDRTSGWNANRGEHATNQLSNTVMAFWSSASILRVSRSADGMPGSIS